MKFKSIFITTLLSLFMIGGVFAQGEDEYVYATLATESGVGYPTPKIIYTSDETIESYVSSASDLIKDLIKKVDELKDAGWEVYKIQMSPQPGIADKKQIYYFRKKKS